MKKVIVVVIVLVILIAIIYKIKEKFENTTSNLFSLTFNIQMGQIIQSHALMFFQYVNEVQEKLQTRVYFSAKIVSNLSSDIYKAVLEINNSKTLGLGRTLNSNSFYNDLMQNVYTLIPTQPNNGYVPYHVTLYLNHKTYPVLLNSGIEIFNYIEQVQDVLGRVVFNYVVSESLHPINIEPGTNFNAVISVTHPDINIDKSIGISENFYSDLPYRLALLRKAF